MNVRRGGGGGARIVELEYRVAGARRGGDPV